MKRRKPKAKPLFSLSPDPDPEFVRLWNEANGFPDEGREKPAVPAVVYEWDVVPLTKRGRDAKR